MKRYLSVLLLVVTSLMLNAQSDKTSKLGIKKTSTETKLLDSNNLDNRNKKHSIMVAFTNKNWNGTGVLMGKEATFSMDWQSVLSDQFIKLEFQSKRKSVDNQDIVFMATAFYKIVNETTVIGNWFDSRGVSFPLKGSIKANEMIIFWGSNKTEMGKTIYRYTDNNEMYVEDFILNKEEYIKFGYSTYKIKD